MQEQMKNGPGQPGQTVSENSQENKEIKTGLSVLDPEFKQKFEKLVGVTFSEDMFKVLFGDKKQEVLSGEMILSQTGIHPELGFYLVVFNNGQIGLKKVAQFNDHDPDSRSKEILKRANALGVIILPSQVSGILQ